MGFGYAERFRRQSVFLCRLAALACLAAAVWWSGLAACALAKPAPENQTAGAARNEDLALKVRLLVRRLDSPVLAERNRAEADLLAMGPRALPVLPKPDSDMSAELQMRLQRIRDRLLEAQTESLLEPSRATIHADGEPFREVLDELLQQTGNEVTLDVRFGVAPDEPIEVDIEDETFWEALDQILDAAGCDLYPYAGQGRMQIVPRPQGQISRTRRAAYAGAFRLEVKQIVAVRDFVNLDNRSLRVILDLTWEPRLEPITIWLPAESIEAVDEEGGPLPKAPGPINPEIPLHTGVSATELTILFGLPPRRVQEISRLRGEFEVLLSGPREAFRFENLAEAAGRSLQAGDATLTVGEVRTAGDSLIEVRMLATMQEPAGSFQSHLSWMLDNEVYLVAPGGERIDVAGTETSQPGAKEMALTYVFALPAENSDTNGYTLVCEFPTGMLRTRVPFEIRSLQLP